MSIRTKYGLNMLEVRTIDLRTTFPMRSPARPMDFFFGKTGSMVESPHTEFARLYYQHGLEWIKKNYSSTKFCSFRKARNKSFDLRMIRLCDSIKKGYMRGKHTNHIIVLDVPFCNSRYNLNEELRTPEVFLGHHRVGVLLSLEQYFVPVLFCVDAVPGSSFVKGGRHAECMKG